MSTYVIGWLVLAVLLGALELVIPGAILGFLGLASAMVAGLLYWEIVTGPVEVLMTWFALSLFLILVVRSFCLKLMPGDSKVENTDEDVDDMGSIVEVCEDIRPEKNGRIKFRDSTWKAQSDHHLKTGDHAIIAGRDGATWIIKPL